MTRTIPIILFFGFIVAVSTLIALNSVAADPAATQRAAREATVNAKGTARDIASSNLSDTSRETINDATMDRLNAKEDRQTVGEYLDDAGITADVKGKFLAQKGLDSLDIKVVTVDGTVTLMGDVDNSSQISLAENVAKSVKGVRKVDNKLMIKR